MGGTGAPEFRLFCIKPTLHNMKLPQNMKRSIARLLMALALFAQWAMPSSAYPAVPATPAQVSAMPEHAGMSCHESQPPSASNCLAHCSQSDQISLDQLQLPAIPASAASWHAAVPPVQGVSGGAFIRIMPQKASGPPIPIRFCSLLN